MAQLKFRFEWYNVEKTVMKLIALEDWKWKDYHAAARACTFSMMQLKHTVDMLIDLRQSATFPKGMAAHGVTFGKKLTPNLSGQVVVLGLPEEQRQALPLNADGTFSATDGLVYFADDEAHANTLLQQLRQGA